MLFFSDFPSLRTDSFLDNIAPRHIWVLRFLFVKAAVVIVLWFVSHWQQALDVLLSAMDVLLSAGKGPVCLSHSSGAQGKLHFVWNFSCYFGD